MSSASLPLAAALVAGFAHALEADHMAAVTTFVSRHPRPLQALGFGVRWGVGHSAALLLVGGLLILLDLSISPPAVRALELGVGAMLVALGLWAIRSALRTGPRTPTTTDAAAHPGHRHDPVTGRFTGWVGAAHGLAGTAGFLALLPAAFLGSPWLAGGYLLMFGAGTVAAMGLYALLAGIVLDRVGGSTPALGAGMRGAAGLVSVGIGVAWMASALTG